MATQFYFKRESLETTFDDELSNYFAKDILDEYGDCDDGNGTCLIPSTFFVYSSSKPIIRQSLTPVLNCIGFRIDKIEPITACLKSKVTILPVPKTDP